MAGAYGVQSQFGVGTAGAGSATLLLEILGENIAQRTERIDTNGLKGTRSRYINRVREGRRRVGGTVTLNPSPTELVFLLQRILGGTPSGTNYPLAEVLPTFMAQSDRVLKVFTYPVLAATRANFRAASGGALELGLDVVGTTESVGNAGTFPALSLGSTLADQPFVYTDSAIVINSTSYQSVSFDLTIDNAIDAERFLNSQTLVTVQATDRVVTVNFGIPYGDGSALYTPGTATISASITFTNGTVSLSFSMSNIHAAWESPVANGRGEMILPINGVAYRSSSTAEIVTTLDSTV